MANILEEAARDHCRSMLLLLISIPLVQMTTFLERQPPGTVHTADVCGLETFQPRCGSGYVTIIQNASYGRMALGRCIKIDMGFLGCKSDVTALVEWRCSGRDSCDVTVPDEQFEQQKPCFELQSYLNVSYFCLKVLTTLDHSCSESRFLKTILPSGYISSQKADCQMKANIWLIEAKPGQRINLTLIDFGVKADPDDFLFGEMDACEKYGDVRDSVTGKTYVICGRKRRTRHIVVSQGNSVEIDFSARNGYKTGEGGMNEFLIYFNAVGCPDPPMDSNTWSERQGDRIFIGCRASGSLYEMTCQETTWLGTYRNCTTDDSHLAATYQDDNYIFSALPKGLVIAAIVAIAIVVGTVIVVVGIIVFKRRRSLDYADGNYTIPNSDKLYVSPDARHQAGEIIHDPQNPKHHHIPGYNTKFQGFPPLDNVGEQQQHKSVQEHDYHCVGSPPTAQPGSDRRGNTHVWDRPLPAPESQHSC